MTRIRCTLALLFGLCFAAETPAQFIPVFNLPTIVQPGISFQLGGRRLRIDGTIPTGDPYTVIIPVTPTPQGFRQVGPGFVPYGYAPIYGAIDQRVTVQIINPPGLSPRAGFKKVYDVSGIDLDVEPASKIWGPKKGELVQAPKDAKKVELAKVMPPEEKKPKVAADLPKPPAPPLPKVEMVPEGRRLNNLGVTAFRNGEYGLAILRFRQAVDVEPPEPRAVFLRGQASIAVGKYKDAVEAIQRGLQITPDWPLSDFRPKVELYDNDLEAWKEHRKQLEDTQRLDPKNADYLFLLGYLAWFDGEREVAADYFRQSRALAVDPRWCDAFLKAAKK